MKIRQITPETRRALELLADAWVMMPTGFRIGPGLEDMKRCGYVETKRERQFPKAPHRVFVRRTAKGRAAVGAEA